MAEYALLINGEKQEFRNYAERPEHIPHKSVEWYPVVREYGGPFEGVDGDAYVVRTVDPSTLPPPIPDRISPRQARLALLSIGKLDVANAAIEQSGDATKIAWEFSSYVFRNDPDVIALASVIGIDADALDQMFVEAAKL